MASEELENFSIISPILKPREFQKSFLSSFLSWPNLWRTSSFFLVLCEINSYCITTSLLTNFSSFCSVFLSSRVAIRTPESFKKLIRRSRKSSRDYVLCLAASEILISPFNTFIFLDIMSSKCQLRYVKYVGMVSQGITSSSIQCLLIIYIN